MLSSNAVHRARTPSRSSVRLSLVTPPRRGVAPPRESQRRPGSSGLHTRSATTSIVSTMVRRQRSMRDADGALAPTDWSSTIGFEWKLGSVRFVTPHPEKRAHESCAVCGGARGGEALSAGGGTVSGSPPRAAILTHGSVRGSASAQTVTSCLPGRTPYDPLLATGRPVTPSN